MFDKYEGIINLEKVLKDVYNYIFTGDLKDLYLQPFIELEGEGTNALCWIKYQGDSYYSNNILILRIMFGENYFLWNLLKN